MASREGATVDGTDGSDFSHRERVVSQYYTRYFVLFLSAIFSLQIRQMTLKTKIAIKMILKHVLN